MTGNHPSLSPFHDGEQILQSEAGVRDAMEKFGRRVIRDHMPQQHRDFYSNQPFVVAGYIDDEGAPWASMLFGEQRGFIQSPDDKTLRVTPTIDPLDPLFEVIQDKHQVGVLGLELSTRRRNRLGTHISAVTQTGFDLKIDQAFGNCPQYIQSRDLFYIDEKDRLPVSRTQSNELDAEAIDLINRSDTFFVASYYSDNSGHASNGADASHRGGKPGFVHVSEDGLLTIPDYAGNNHFNTLGNLLKNPRAGLLFVDWKNGHCLSLTGSTEIITDSPLIKHFNGALRLWTVRPQKVVWLKNLLPFRFGFNEYSPNSLMTGDWQEAEQRLSLENKQNQWRNFEVIKVQEESAQITSFYLRPESGPLVTFKAGQFLPVQVEIDGQVLSRTYSLSSAPDEDSYRISVKRDGKVSAFLHDTLHQGSMLKGRHPAGGFTLQSDRPTVLLAAGVGVTPFVSMLKQARIEQFKLRKRQPLTLFFQVKNAQNRPFFDELNQLVNDNNQGIRVIWSMSQPEPHLKQGQDFHYHGRLSKELLQAVLPIDDYDFMICGPGEFMQQQYDTLLDLGVKDKRIFAEAFGPAALKRQQSGDEAVKQYGPDTPPATNAVVKFAQSQVEQAWTAEDGNLLEFAEQHGMQPEFSCRNGQCGSCKVKVTQGKVSHIQDTSFPLEQDEALLCCAVPAASSEEIATVTLEV